MERDSGRSGSTRFGIYLNAQELKVVRINSPYWFPQEPEWVFLTPEVNATLLQLRHMAGEQRLVEDPDALAWGSLPPRE